MLHRTQSYADLNEYFNLPDDAVVIPQRVKEKKYLDYYFDDRAIKTTTQPFTVFDPNIGPGGSQVSGSVARIKSIQLRGSLRAAPSGGIIPDARTDLFLIYDKQPNSQTPSNTVLFASTSNYPMLNMAYRDRFRILYHKHIETGYTNVSGGNMVYSRAPGLVAIEAFIPLDLETEFDTSGTPVRGDIYLSCMTPDVAIDGLYLDLFIRTRFQ